MPTQISPMLAIHDTRAAVAFYESAFGAQLLWSIDENHAVAGLSSLGAPFFLAEQAPAYGTRSPHSAGFTTVRIELFVDDPVAVHRQAVSAGATERSPVQQYQHKTFGPAPIRRMLQGSVLDPFGHIWLIGRFL